MNDKKLYDPIASVYESFSDAAPQIEIGIRTVLELAGNIQGKSVLDLACGQGLFSRLYKSHGASRVIGVDISANMLEIAKNISQQHGDGIEYHVRDVCKMESLGKFDIINASWLFCHAVSLEELESMFRVIADNLAPSGKLVAYTFSPDYRLAQGNCTNYLCDILSEEPHGEGLFYTAKFMAPPHNSSFPFTMYSWSREHFAKASKKAGLQLEWHKPMLLQSDIDNQPAGFWDTYQNNCHEIALVCKLR
ncbi:class I SAM-dependent DNA methyltransferase [Xenorhabdus sp. KK7.4]|uniref:class I SAM-dependent DNA methyltransferase n=1 Tax=Xenorhabdus sp. KK7.4 TaxID=1851572 RepID=UPI000C05680C|nr:class I SAM-dependent methyltransferase [Xenorhabdus sp. KK7.4]PHM52734.1 ubiquinone biosynthesis methyltransferase UbiE [Xenorhabdus sp. KK7.4]